MLTRLENIYSRRTLVEIINERINFEVNSKGDACGADGRRQLKLIGDGGGGELGPWPPVPMPMRRPSRKIESKSILCVCVCVCVRMCAHCLVLSPLSGKSPKSGSSHPSIPDTTHRTEPHLLTTAATLYCTRRKRKSPAYCSIIFCCLSNRRQVQSN